MYRKITFSLVFLLIVPVLLHAQPLDSLRLLWRYEAISGVTAHAFSHSGSLLALVNENTVLLWDMNAGKFFKTFSIPSHFYEKIAFSQTDDEIILLSRAFSRRPRWDPEAPQATAGYEIRVNLLSSEAYTVPQPFIENAKWSLSPNSRLIAILTDSGQLSIRDSKDFSIHEKWQLPPIRKSYLAKTYSGWIPPYSINFVPNSSDIIVLWGGEATVFDSHSLANHKVLTDSIDRLRDVYIRGESVFLPQETLLPIPEVYRSPILNASILQPPIVNITQVSSWHRFKDRAQRPKSALLFGNGKYLASRYAVWMEQLIDYGTAHGGDTLIITTQSHPDYEWSIGLSNFMDVLDEVPGNPNQLLLGDGSTFMILDAEKHTLRYLTCSSMIFSGFGKDGNTLLESYGPVSYAFDGKIWTKIGSALGTPSERASDAPFLKDYLRVVPAGENKVFAYCDFWSKFDSAHIFDVRTGESLRTFVGGLNGGIEAGAVSGDNKWALTVSREGGGKVWRASDASLKLCFDAKHAQQAAWTKNDRYLISAQVYENDSGITVQDLETGKSNRVAIGTAVVSMFKFNEDYSRLLVFRYHRNKYNGMGPMVTELYETPLSWRVSDTTFDPKTVYLPLRFYLPADAQDAVDSNGMKFSPPRTNVKLELRYADGKLLEKILNGPLHKGKWHIWEYEMTKYPKGTYIMHTEIGGVVNDEKMEIR